MDRVQSDIQEIIEKRELFESFSNSKFLITGATGFIGSMLIRALVAADKKYALKLKVVGMIRNIDKAKKVLNDVIDKIVLSSTDDVIADYIIHTVSPTTSKFFIEKPVETIKSSVESTISMLEIAKKNNAKVVYLSSMEQYGIPYANDQTMTEEKIGTIDHLNVRSSYSESKRLCECLCASYASEYGIDVKIARLAQTIGAGIPLTDSRMPMQFAKAIVYGEDIVLHTEGNSLSNFVYITDAIKGIFTILKKGEIGQAYNVCNDRETRSVREIAELVCNKLADGKINVKINIQENMGYAPNVKMYLNSNKLIKLGWSPTIRMEDAYKRLKEYLLENKAIQ